MRISTFNMYQTSTRQINTLQSDMARTQMQLSTNRRILTPADDPVASARVLEVAQSQEMNSQFATNRDNARSSLANVEMALQNAGNLMTNIQTLIVNAGNGSMQMSDRMSLATEIEGRMQDLLGVANTTDGAGGYLFSGFKTTTQPFVLSPCGATYQGDQGQRQLQVGGARMMDISASGGAVFENNPTGNGTFQSRAAAGNTGTGVIAPGSVVDRGAYVNHDYSISFTVSGTPQQTTYDVTDTTTVPPTTVLAAQPFKSGEQITFGGMAVDVKGEPANGDSFTIKPSEKESVFTTLSDLLVALRKPTDTGADRAALTDALNIAGDNLKSAHNTVLTVQASVGARLKELDYLDEAGDDLNVQYASTLSDLQDLDIAATISLFSQQQTTLQAAHMSFKTMAGLSLFNYL